MCRIYIRHTDLNIFQICSRNGGSLHTSANETAVTREDFSSPLGAFHTQIPKLDSKKFYKRVPPKLFSIYSCGVFLIYSCGRMTLGSPRSGVTVGGYYSSGFH